MLIFEYAISKSPVESQDVGGGESYGRRTLCLAQKAGAATRKTEFLTHVLSICFSEYWSLRVQTQISMPHMSLTSRLLFFFIGETAQPQGWEKSLYLNECMAGFNL